MARDDYCDWCGYIDCPYPKECRAKEREDREKGEKRRKDASNRPARGYRFDRDEHGSARPKTIPKSRVEDQLGPAPYSHNVSSKHRREGAYPHKMKDKERNFSPPRKPQPGGNNIRTEYPYNRDMAPYDFDDQVRRMEIDDRQNPGYGRAIYQEQSRGQQHESPHREMDGMVYHPPPDRFHPNGTPIHRMDFYRADERRESNIPGFDKVYKYHKGDDGRPYDSAHLPQSDHAANIVEPVRDSGRHALEKARKKKDKIRDKIDSARRGGRH